MNSEKSYSRVIRIIGIFWLLYGFSYAIGRALTCWAWTCEINEWIVRYSINSFIIENTLPALAITIMGTALIINARKLFKNLQTIRYERGCVRRIFLYIVSWLWITVGIYLIPKAVKSFLYVKPYRFRFFGWPLADIHSIAGIWIEEYGYPLLLVISGFVLFFFIKQCYLSKTIINIQNMRKLDKSSLLQISGYLWVVAGVILVAKFIKEEVIYKTVGYSYGYFLGSDLLGEIVGRIENYGFPYFLIITGIALLIICKNSTSKRKEVKY